MPKAIFYQSIGPELSRYDIDVDGAALTRRELGHHRRRQRAIRLAAPVEEIPLCGVERRRAGHHSGHQARRHRVPHRGRRHVALSRRQHARCRRGRCIAASTARANICSPPTTIRATSRSIASIPTAASAMQVPPREKLDVGIFAHQVLTTPGDRTAIMVTRGNNAAGGQARRPGRAQGLWLQGRRARQPRLDRARQRAGLRPAPFRFPSDRAVAVPLGRAPERTARLQAQRRRHAAARRRRSSRTRSPTASITRHTQMAGAIHVHPNGRFVYHDQPQLRHRGDRRPQGVQGRREQHRGVLDRSRRAASRR